MSHSQLDMSFLQRKLKRERRARRYAKLLDKTGPIMLFASTMATLVYVIFR